MTENIQSTFARKRLDYDLLLLEENDPVKATIYYQRLLKERSRIREEEGHNIGLEERKAIYQAVSGMSEEEVEAEKEIMHKETEEKRAMKEQIEADKQRQNQPIRNISGGRTFADYASEALEKREEEKEKNMREAMGLPVDRE